MPSPWTLLTTSRYPSYTSSTTGSLSEGTTASEPVGLGSTSAHFFQHLGSFAVRRVDAHIVNRRLLDIQTRFPHTNGESVPDDDYDTLIEVSRPGLSYDGSCLRRALRLLSLQIRHGHVGQFIRQLLIIWQREWHRNADELQMLLKELGNECSKMDKTIAKRASNSNQAQLPGRAFLDFCLQFCQVEPEAFVLVKDLMHQFIPIYNSHPLTILCREPNLGTPLSVLSYRHSPRLRYQTWNRLGPEFIQRRLTSIKSYLQIAEPLLREPPRSEIFDACFDILEFSRSRSSDGLSIQAIDCFVRIITSGIEGVWWDTLSDVLVENTHKDISDIVDLMLNDSPQIQNYFSSSLRRTLTTLQSNDKSIQHCFINLILHTISGNSSFKKTLSNTAFCSLFLSHTFQYLHPPISTKTVWHSYQTVREILRAIAGENSVYHFPRDAMLRTQKQTWEKVVDIFGQRPEVYMPVRSPRFMASHELRQSPYLASTTFLSIMESTEEKSNRSEQIAKSAHDHEDFLRVATKLGLLSEMSFPDSAWKLDDSPEDFSFRQRKRESDFVRVAGQLGLM
ncbi:hypothetical protein DFJ43DRAFT_1089054 [Lentinula guzmanii]|uniref:Uncharacterized protein n=1 Tax=Lentinula guzmanii TaxID=2804957 RepID=A0AA38JBG1_9AGAR|nr:hypothetical protein DFJ43DRAFT_1089054 [Lentinula guzmanii]